MVHKDVRMVLRTRANIEIYAARHQMDIERTLQTNPDLIILDVYVPKVHGFSAAKQIKKILPTVPIIMLSMQDSLELIQAAQQVGAQGFVTKSESPPFC
jgi:DNA-binding NarL/FixJ family response regulator